MIIWLFRGVSCIVAPILWIFWSFRAWKCMIMLHWALLSRFADFGNFDMGVILASDCDILLPIPVFWSRFFLCNLRRSLHFSVVDSILIISCLEGVIFLDSLLFLVQFVSHAFGDSFPCFFFLLVKFTCLQTPLATNHEIEIGHSSNPSLWNVSSHWLLLPLHWTHPQN